MRSETKRGEETMEEIMKKYINKKVVWNESYKDNISNDIEILDSICFHGGFDKLDEPVFLNKTKDRYMTLDYVKQNINEEIEENKRC
jgi:hypothetical protein